MRKNLSFVFRAGVVAFALCATNAMAQDFDACKEEGGHTGQGITERGQSDVSVKDAIPDSKYHYEIWYQQGNNSMTYYPDGSFSAEWNGSSDFLARVGLKYNSDKPYTDLSPITADFNFTKQGSASYSYVGIYGWTKEPLSEYYITDDWFGNRPAPGQKKGELTVDGDTYDIYIDNRWNAPSILDHNTDFIQYFSIRRNARQCGHIDISAHMKKWEEYGFKGMLYESKILVEAGGGATGKIDFSIARMDDAITLAAAQSSSSEPESSSSEAAPESSSEAAPESSSEATPASSSEAAPASSSEATPASSSEVAPASSSADAIRSEFKVVTSAGAYQVFNMLGKFIGLVELSEGTSLNQAVKARFGKAGVYMVKRGSFMTSISVK